MKENLILQLFGAVVLIAYIYLVFRWFLKGFYKDARDLMQQARQEFRQVTGHEPPKSSRDRWFKWKAH